MRNICSILLLALAILAQSCASSKKTAGNRVDDVYYDADAEQERAENDGAKQAQSDGTGGEVYESPQAQVPETVYVYQEPPTQQAQQPQIIILGPQQHPDVQYPRTPGTFMVDGIEYRMGWRGRVAIPVGYNNPNYWNTAYGNQGYVDPAYYYDYNSGAFIQIQAGVSIGNQPVYYQQGYDQNGNKVYAPRTSVSDNTPNVQKKANQNVQTPVNPQYQGATPRTSTGSNSSTRPSGRWFK